jgi:hypothetical protein
MADINTHSLVAEKGFLDIELDPTLDLFAEIEKLKKEKKRDRPGALLSRAGYTGCGRLHRR